MACKCPVDDGQFYQVFGFLLQKWWNMLVEWQLYKWGNLFQMYLTELIPIALESHLVYVRGFVHSVFQQWFPYGSACFPFLLLFILSPCNRHLVYDMVFKDVLKVNPVSKYDHSLCQVVCLVKDVPHIYFNFHFRTLSSIGIEII